MNERIVVFIHRRFRLRRFRVYLHGQEVLRSDALARKVKLYTLLPPLLHQHLVTFALHPQPRLSIQFCGSLYANRFLSILEGVIW